MAFSIYPEPVSSSGPEVYGVYAENTSGGTVVKTATVSIPSGIYAVNQTSTDSANSSSFAGNIATGTENKAVKFTGTVTSVSVTVQPDIDLLNSFNTWTSRTQPFGNTAIKAATYGNGLFVIGSNNGGIATSTDGITWTTRTGVFGTTQINRITFGNNIFVGVAEAGRIGTSTDGITWTTRTNPSGTSILYDVQYGNGLWVACGANGRILTSTDAVTWTTRTSTFGTTFVLGLLFANNLWIAAGDSARIATSFDGITWTTRTPGGVTAPETLYGGWYAKNNTWNIWTGGNTIITSTDGVNWTSSDNGFTPTALSEIINVNNIYIAPNGGSLQVSKDGVNWLPKTGVGSGVSIAAVAGGPGNVGYITVGTSRVATNNTVTAFKSTIGTLFTKVNATEAS
jgi:hypothetical protein